MLEVRVGDAHCTQMRSGRRGEDFEEVDLESDRDPPDLYRATVVHVDKPRVSADKQLQIRVASDNFIHARSVLSFQNASLPP